MDINSYSVIHKEMTCANKSYLDMLRQNKVDGAIVATHYLQTSDYKDLSLPLVAMDVFLDESIPSVHSNHIRGGKLAARPFIDWQWRAVSFRFVETLTLNPLPG